MTSPESQKEVENSFKALRKEAQNSGLTKKEIRLEFLQAIRGQRQKKNATLWSRKLRLVFLIFFPVLLSCGGFFLFRYVADYYRDDVCLINYNEIVGEISRKVTNCSLMCEGLREFPKVSNLSKGEFVAKFAYSGRPVVVTDAAVNWTALQTFNFTFLKNLHDSSKGSYRANEEECQFFPYKTEFQSLKEAFAMPKKRAEWKAAPWYFGW